MSKRKTLIYKMKAELRRSRAIVKACSINNVKFLEKKIEKLEKTCLELNKQNYELKGKLKKYTDVKAGYISRVFRAVLGK